MLKEACEESIGVLENVISWWGDACVVRYADVVVFAVLAQSMIFPLVVAIVDKWYWELTNIVENE